MDFDYNKNKILYDDYYNLITSKGYYKDLNSINLNLNLDNNNQFQLNLMLNMEPRRQQFLGMGHKQEYSQIQQQLLWSVSWENMFKNNKNPVIYATSTKEYFCAYWGQDIRLFKNLFWISATICFIFLLTYIGSYNVVCCTLCEH